MIDANLVIANFVEDYFFVQSGGDLSYNFIHQCLGDVPYHVLHHGNFIHVT